MKAEGGWAAVCTEYCSISPRPTSTPYVSARLWDDEDVRRAAAHDRGGARARGAGRGRAVARRRSTPRRASRASRRSRRRRSRATSTASRCRKAMAAADIRRVQDDWVRRGPAGARRRLRHRLRLRLAHLPADAVPLAVLQPPHGRVRRLVREPGAVLARGARARARGRRRRLRDRRAHRRRHAASGPGVELGRGARVHPPRPTAWSTCGTCTIGALSGVAAGRQRARRGSSSRATSSSGRGRLARGDRQADRRRRPVHRPRHDGRGRSRRRSRPDRRRAARRSPTRSCRARSRRAATTRSASASAATSASRGSICGPPPRLHAERDRRRGVPPRLAPRAVRPGRATPTRRARRRRRAGRDGVRDRARQARHRAACTWSTRRRHRRLHALGAAAARPRGVGPADRLPARARSSGCRTSSSSPACASTPPACATYGAEIVVVATGARWATDGMNGVTRGADPGRGRGARRTCLTPEQVMVDGQAAAGRAGRASSTARATSRAPGSPRCCGPRATRWSCSPASTSSPTTATRRSRGCACAGACTTSASAAHRGSTATAIDPGGVDGRRRVRAAVPDRRATASCWSRSGISDDALYRELAADADALAAAGDRAACYAIGDCVAPRLIADAIFDGHRLAREIDSPDPSRPLPYLRERPLVVNNRGQTPVIHRGAAST